MPLHVIAMVRSGSARNVQQHRDRQRAKGLRLGQLLLPDTRARGFTDQVTHDIAAVAGLSSEDEAMIEAFERLAEEDPKEGSGAPSSPLRSVATQPSPVPSWYCAPTNLPIIRWSPYWRSPRPS